MLPLASMSSSRVVEKRRSVRVGPSPASVDGAGTVGRTQTTDLDAPLVAVKSPPEGPEPFTVPDLFEVLAEQVAHDLETLGVPATRHHVAVDVDVHREVRPWPFVGGQ